MVENATLLIIVMIAALCCFMYLGYLAGKKTSNTSADFMVAGGKMPFWLTTATLLATFICGGTVLGGAGIAYTDGLQATIPDPFGAALCLILGGAFFLGLIRKTGAVSAGSVYNNRYGTAGAAVASLCMIPTFVFFAGAQVAAAAKLFQILLGWDFLTIAILTGAFVILYTAMGGITAVAWTDFVQIALLVLGVIVLFPIVYTHLGDYGGHAAAVEVMGKDFFGWGLNGDHSFSGIIMYLALWIGTSAGAIPGCDVIQRGLVAKTPGVARWSGIVSGIMMVLIGILVVYIGAWSNLFVVKGLFTPQQLAAVAEDSELLIPLLSTHFLPPALVALFFVGLLGAIMSSADSALFAPATIISNDIVRPYFIKKGKRYQDSDLTKWTRWAVIGIGVVATLMGAFTQSVFTLMVIGFTVQIVLFFPLTLALYWKHANKSGAVAGIIVGMTTVFGLMISQGTIDYDPYWVLVFLPMLTGLLTQVAVSFATAKKDPPLPLSHADGSVIKWPELATGQSAAKKQVS